MDWITMTYPEKPNAKNQSYYTTEAGKEVLRLKQEGEKTKTLSETRQKASTEEQQDIDL